MSNVLELVAALQALEAYGSIPEPTTDYGEYGEYEVTHPLVDKCEDLACACLITNGQYDFAAIQDLETHGYRICYAERFGWLIGGITTSVGTIYYG